MFEIAMPYDIDSPPIGFGDDWGLPKGPHPEPRMPGRRRPGLWWGPGKATAAWT